MTATALAQVPVPASAGAGTARRIRLRSEQRDHTHTSHDPVTGCQRWCRTCHRECQVDEMAVQRAVDGDPPARLTVAERAAAVAILHQRGLTGREIAVRVRCTIRTVTRIRHRLGLRQVPPFRS